ncbi:MAG: hypothetical protein PW843_28245 [Azospirillaceae bacterium]|nr:hypothetical protein [Azospirillaceae bacterium]
MPHILVATFNGGLFRVTPEAAMVEFTGRFVRSLTPDGKGGVLAIADGNRLYRRSPEGAWAVIAQSDHELACCVAVGEVIFVGTEDARLWHLDADGIWHHLDSFDDVEGRDTWYAGAMLVDGVLRGPPLGVRTLAVTCDGAALLANVHVGGIPRSADDGQTWRPTLPVDWDVHQVNAHPTRPDLVIAAAAAGLCLSRDGGATWTLERRGLHATYGSAVAWGRHDLFVAASTDHFSAQGALYRRPIDSDGPLQRVGDGLPPWQDGIIDSDCIATRGALVAIIDRAGRLYLSQDDGNTWTELPHRIPGPMGLHIL